MKRTIAAASLAAFGVVGYCSCDRLQLPPATNSTSSTSSSSTASSAAGGTTDSTGSTTAGDPPAVCVMHAPSLDRLARSLLPPKIVGGTPVLSVDVYPWMASMQTRSGNHFCGCSVFAGHYCVTAAHCIVYEQWRVQIGLTNLDSPEPSARQFDVHAASDVLVHDDYDLTPFDWDLAVIWLPTAANLPSVELNNSQDPVVGTQALAIGWGTVSSGGSLSNELLHVRVPIVDWSRCKRDFYSHLTGRMLCADVVGAGSCQGDSGGPLVSASTGQLMGIVSHGRGCADGAPGVYTRVDGAVAEQIRACTIDKEAQQ